MPKKYVAQATTQWLQYKFMLEHIAFEIIIIII